MALFYAGNLPESLDFGHILVISGRTTPTANRFDLNIGKGKKPEDHIGLHFSARFTENSIVRNSYDGQWGKEERKENKDDDAEDCPIIKGEDFQIYILVGDYGFNIAVNGRPYCTFEHKLTYGDMKAITVYYDVQSIRSIDHRCAFPQPHPVIQCDDDSVAFSHDLPDTPSVGDVIIISAVPFGNPAGRFELQFNQGSNTDKEALHISTRFDENVVVRNDRDDNGDWGEEETHGNFPFALNQLFRIAIAFGENCFRIAVNGNYLCDFVYRNDDIFDNFNGFTIDCIDGLQLLVRGVDHMKCNYPNLEGFHVYSNPYDPLISNV